MLDEDQKTYFKQLELAKLVEKFSVADGDHITPIPSLHLVRDSRSDVPVCRIQKPSLCIVAQGEKVIMLANERYQYGVSDYLAVSLDVPITGRAVDPSPKVPYLAIRLDLEANQIFQIMKETELLPENNKKYHKGLFVGKMNHALLDAAVRLVGLLETPKDIPALAPLVIREMIYRLLSDDHGGVFKQIALVGNKYASIAEVVERIKNNYDEPLRIEELAELGNMSTSSLYRHFKELTAMTPVQYQKQIRLQEARRRLLTESTHVADIAFEVGYESPSQFSREYARLFGFSPVSDIKRFV
ncbi:AraC family transcriptional regulator [Saccharibacillus sp. O23]|uniref:AraC family transcriptional regulator n=1 Tax=Saccharibacillus sp. O23 TaxID=2009338 RepID=UPI000B4E665A|nr:AraC family transcriptional regulator [Saccharibacillus sp. O23]OWR32581.1 AraC family transcriptional regulator [Saccharibacillus sp. O23]